MNPCGDSTHCHAALYVKYRCEPVLQPGWVYAVFTLRQCRPLYSYRASVPYVPAVPPPPPLTAACRISTSRFHASYTRRLLTPFPVDASTRSIFVRLEQA